MDLLRAGNLPGGPGGRRVKADNDSLDSWKQPVLGVYVRGPPPNTLKYTVGPPPRHQKAEFIDIQRETDSFEERFKKLTGLGRTYPLGETSRTKQVFNPSDVLTTMAKPSRAANMVFPSWCEPHIEEVAQFYHDNVDIFDELTAEDYRYLLSVSARNYSWSNSPSMNLNDFMFGKFERGTLFTVKSLDYLDCYRIPATGNSFTIYDKNTREELVEYVYQSANGPDRAVFLRFVKHRLAQKVLGSGLEGEILDPSMSKYEDMWCDEMLEGEGLKVLYEQRDYRSQVLQKEKMLKMSMTTTSALPCTLDKYNFFNPYMEENPDALVLIYGSGDRRCALRFYWLNTYCIDPVWDGPPEMGFRGSHDKFHRALDCGKIVLPLKGRRFPGYIVNDACGFIDQHRVLMDGEDPQHTLRGRTRAMCPDKTNKMAGEIVEYWVRKGYSSPTDDGRWFATKSGIAFSYPKIFRAMVSHDRIKTRPTNVELSNLIKGEFHRFKDSPTKPKPPDVPTVSWARSCNRYNKVVVVGNNQRMCHDMTGTFPVRTYAYPKGFDRCMENARKNVVLVVPHICGVHDKRQTKARKRILRNLDFDEDEHEVDPSTIARSTCGMSNAEAE